MDHLPYGPGGSLTIPIPYICGSDFNFNGAWLDYPKDQGFDLEMVQHRMWGKLPPSRWAPFLQRWLFFGLLRAVLPTQIELRVEDFVRIEADGKKYITTSKLRDYLERWAEIHSNLSEEDQVAMVQRNRAIFDDAQYIIYNLSETPTSPVSGLFPALPLECALGCALLGQALSIANIPFDYKSDWVSAWVWGSGTLLLEQLELQGWCPFLVDNLGKHHELSTIYYFCTLGGPKIRRDHRRCFEDVCYATRNVDAKHATAGCECGLAAPSAVDIAEAIDSDRIPVMRCSESRSSGILDLEIAAASEASPSFVAISHVWSDGLGNPHGNQIHVCQARRIQRAVDQIPLGEKGEEPEGAGWWWLDTLCVPKEEQYKDAEIKAISSMREIYLQADSILLVDSDLDACDDDAGALEVLCRLRLSNWIRRLWTFQEGRFARRIYLLVGSRPRLLIDMVEAIANTVSGDLFQGRILWELMVFLRPLFGSAILKEEPQTTDSGFEESPELIFKTKDGAPITERAVSDVTRAVLDRTSTFQKDEAQCLALLLNLDTPQVKEVIEAVEGEEKDSYDHGPSEIGMVTLLRLVNDAGNTFDLPGCFPPSMIFPLGKKLRTPGFRWAPQSFLSASTRREVFSTLLPYQIKVTGSEPIMRHSGSLCEHGLRVMFPGLLLASILAAGPGAPNQRTQPRLNPFFIVDTTASTPVPLSENQNMPPLWRCRFVHDEDGRAWTEDIAPRREDSNTLAIIVGDFVGLASGKSFDCALVRIRGRGENGEYIVSRLGKIAGSATPAFDSHEWMREPWKRVEGSWLSLNQMWCVD
ncbi:hypothetical protein GQ53DRAFT_821386 [Thozetella sp. PMI_491]|nr:hypothetical protein GQ53DRAFT_821386 [Thozetella sp. PMI_491]